MSQQPIRTKFLSVSQIFTSKVSLNADYVHDKKLCVGRPILIVLAQTPCLFKNLTHDNKEPSQRSRYSDWLRAGRPRGWSSSPGGGKN
jgi:hypothetical protein